MRRTAAVVAVAGGVLTVVGAVLVFGLAGGLISAGLLLVAAGASEL